MTRYLLGDLAEEEMAVLEERFLSNDAEFEEVEIAEGELIDRYVRNDLAASDHQKFQQKLRTSPRLVERVEFARMLAERLTPRADPEPAKVVKSKTSKDAKTPWWNPFASVTGLTPALRFANVAMIALLLLTSTAFLLVWIKLREQSQQLIADQQRLNELKAQVDEQTAKNAGLERERTEANQKNEEQEKLLADYRQQLEERRLTPTSILSFFVNPGGALRSGGGREQAFPIPAGVGDIELRLNVEGSDYPEYNASLQSIDRKPILRRNGLKPVRRGNRQYIPFKIAGKLLTPGSYHVHVDGLTPTGAVEDFTDYLFRVTAR